MRIKLNIPENSVQTDTAYMSDVLGEQKNFPVLAIGRDSYIEEAWAEVVFDSGMIYNLQVGRYTSIAGDVKIIDLSVRGGLMGLHIADQRESGVKVRWLL